MNGVLPEKNSTEKTIAEFERQVERGSLFTHTALSENAQRIVEVESFLYGLINILIKGGIVTQEEISEAASKVHEEMATAGETISPGVMLRLDSKEATDNLVNPVNCTQRIHICQAACCKLSFALSQEEVEARSVYWDLGRPYTIRQGVNGKCIHNDPVLHICSVYENRPVVCRAYNCANDRRIWEDFERMRLNEEWICENMGENKPQLATILMQRVEDTKS